VSGPPYDFAASFGSAAAGRAQMMGTGVLALLYVIGIYAILYGILEIWLSLRLREYATTVTVLAHRSCNRVVEI
jgi:uncharacterized membrane protein HdeD (DUF308 family)